MRGPVEAPVSRETTGYIDMAFKLRQSELDRQDQLKSHDAQQPWYVTRRLKYQEAIDKAAADMAEYEQMMATRAAFRAELVESLR